MNSNNLSTQNDYYFGCVSRISLHQARIELNNGIVDVTILSSNELSDSINLVLKLNKNFCNSSLKIECLCLQMH